MKSKFLISTLLVTGLGFTLAGCMNGDIGCVNRGIWQVEGENYQKEIAALDAQKMVNSAAVALSGTDADVHEKTAVNMEANKAKTKAKQGKKLTKAEEKALANQVIDGSEYPMNQRNNFMKTPDLGPLKPAQVPSPSYFDTPSFGDSQHEQNLKMRQQEQQQELLVGSSHHK